MALDFSGFFSFCLIKLECVVNITYEFGIIFFPDSTSEWIEITLFLQTDWDFGKYLHLSYIIKGEVFTVFGLFLIELNGLIDFFYFVMLWGRVEVEGRLGWDIFFVEQEKGAGS